MGLGSLVGLADWTSRIDVIDSIDFYYLFLSIDFALY